MNTEQTPQKVEIQPAPATAKLEELRVNLFRAVKAFIIVLILFSAYNWLTQNTDLGKRFKLSVEVWLSLGSGVAIAFWQGVNDKNKQKIEAATNFQEENRALIDAHYDKTKEAIGKLERRIDSALLQITQQQTDFGEFLITSNQLQAEIENHEDLIANNRHESLEKDFEVYKELTLLKVEVAHMKGALGMPLNEDPPTAYKRIEGSR